MCCDSICAFIFNFTGSKGPYGDCLKLLCHFVCKSFSSLNCYFGFHPCTLLLVCRPGCTYYFEMEIAAFTRMIKRWAAVKAASLDFECKMQSSHSAGPLEINTTRRALKFIYMPLNAYFRGNNNNQVKVQFCFFGSTEVCRMKTLKRGTPTSSHSA